MRDIPLLVVALTVSAYWVRVGASRLDMPDLIGNTVTVTLTLGDDVFAQNITLTPTPTRRRFTKTAN